MNLFRWLFASSRFERVPDAFTLDRAQLWPEISTAIEYQQQQGNVVWVVAHFADQFFEMQRQLNQWQIDYQIVGQAIEPKRVSEMSRENRSVVFLALAELLRVGNRGSEDFEGSLGISILAIERHPMIDFDRQLEAAARQIPGRVKFGYYLALNDPAFHGQISESVVSMLKHFGLKENQLINSITASRAFERIQRKSSATYDRSLRADSAVEWLALQNSRQGKNT